MVIILKIDYFLFWVYIQSDLQISAKSLEKRQYFPLSGSDKRFKGTIVNRTVSSICLTCKAK